MKFWVGIILIALGVSSPGWSQEKESQVRLVEVDGKPAWQVSAEGKTVVVEKSSQEALIASSPSSVRQSLGAWTLAKATSAETIMKNFALESVNFYSAIGAMAVYKCVIQYSQHPHACVDLMTQMTDPFGQLAFGSFIYTAGKVGGVAQVLAKARLLNGPVVHYLKSPMLWGQIGMVAGALTQGVLEELYHDPDAQLLLKTFLTPNGHSKLTQTEYEDLSAAESRLYKKWVVDGRLKQFVPGFAAMVSSSLLSTVTIMTLKKAALTYETKMAFVRELDGTLIRYPTKVLAVRPLLVRLGLSKGVGRIFSVGMRGGFTAGGPHLWLFLAFNDFVVTPYVMKEYSEWSAHKKYERFSDRLQKEFEKSLAAGEASHDLAIAFKEHADFLSGEWRTGLRSKFEELRYEWINHAAKILPEVESAAAFYRSLLESRPEVSNSEWGVYNALQATEWLALDFSQIKEFSEPELFYGSQMVQLGLDRNLVLGWIEQARKMPSLSLEKRFREIKDAAENSYRIQALNAGVDYYFAMNALNKRNELDMAVRANKVAGVTIPPSRYGELRLIDRSISFDGYGKPLGRTMRGIPYNSQSERFLIAMICGTRIELGEESYSFPQIGGLQSIEFRPPRILSSADPACGKISNIKSKINGENLISYVLKRVRAMGEGDLDRYINSYFHVQFHRYQMKIDKLVRAEAEKSLIKTWFAEGASTPLNAPLLGIKPLLGGGKASLIEQMDLYISMLRQTKVLFTKETQKAMEIRIRNIQARLNGTPEQVLGILEEEIPQIDGLVREELDYPNEDHPKLQLMIQILSAMGGLVIEESTLENMIKMLKDGQFEGVNARGA